MNTPHLEVITKNAPIDSVSLDQIIKERRLLKTKVKLIHISLFDHDLQTLNKEGLGIETLRLNDFRLTTENNLIVPIYSKIIPQSSNKILESYLIYLSYLYYIDLLTMYKTNYKLFYKIFLSINLPPKIKMDLFELIKYQDGNYFSSNIELLNNAEIRENIDEDKKRLRRINVN